MLILFSGNPNRSEKLSLKTKKTYVLSDCIELTLIVRCFQFNCSYEG